MRNRASQSSSSRVTLRGGVAVAIALAMSILGLPSMSAAAPGDAGLLEFSTASYSVGEEDFSLQHPVFPSFDRDGPSHTSSAPVSRSRRTRHPRAGAIVGSPSCFRTPGQDRPRSSRKVRRN